VTEEPARAKILIVEDEALIAHEIRQRLTKMGWDVVGTAFGEEAVELALETRPDLLLSDIQLRHGLSGIDLAEKIQTLMDIPIVFLTAFSDEDTVARAKTVTPFGYIIKPVENRDLQITIEMALYKFRVEKELKEKQQLLETALACIGNALIFLDQEGKIININQDARELLGREKCAT
jgi:two-component system cell cycle sensor histidine kinase/response regulator CckA